MGHRGRIPERIGHRVRGFLQLALAAGLISGSGLYSPAARAADGKELFEMSCATCHLGGGGLLGAPRTPDLFADPLLRGETEGAIVQAVRFGVNPPRMPRFESGLAAEEIDAIVRYVLAMRAANRTAR
jgi:mono/diheme cytochrome c family protein